MREYIESSMTFDDYVKLIDDLLAENKTTGKNQSDTMVGYGRLNRQRMHRLEKTLVIDEIVRSVVAKIERRQIWLIITEGWCGDASQNIPVFEKLAAESDKIETRYVLRDEVPELMDRFLSNGARSIPKLVAVDAETFDVIWSWGARPKPLQELFVARRAEGADSDTVHEEIQRWYNVDKGRSAANEIAELLSEHDEPLAASANSN